MKRTELERHFRNHGCLLHHRGGNHDVWLNPANMRKTSVPRHREVKKGTVRAMNLAWYAAGLRGETTEVPARGLTWKDIRKLNDRIYRKQHRRSLKAVLADYIAYHKQMLELIDKVPDRDFVTLLNLKTLWVSEDEVVGPGLARLKASLPGLTVE